MFVTIIVPSYNDNLRLKKCLFALDKQCYPRSLFEVIVVNNSLEDLNISLPGKNFFIVNEPKPGSYAARNKALGLAKGDVIAFTDSDCIPSNSWIEEGVKAFVNENLHLVAGRVAVYPRKLRMSPVECYESIFAFDQESNARQGVSVTANLFCRVGVFSSIGTFDDSLYSGGDVEWTKRATSNGYSISYCDRSIVKHPARYTWKELAQKVKRTTGGKLKANNKYRLYFLKSHFPPVDALMKIAKSRESSLKVKFYAFLIAYRVKLFRYYYFVKIKSGKHPLERV